MPDDEPEGQLTSPPASDPEPPEEQPQEAPPDEPVEPPAQEEEPPPAEGETPVLSDEDWAKLKELAPERFAPDPEEVKRTAQSLRDQEKAQERPKPEADPFYRAIAQQANESLQRISQAQQQLASGELPENVDGLMADIAVSGAEQAASERRGHIVVNRAVFERELGITFDADGKASLDEYDDLLTSLESAQQNAYRLRQQAVREYDPKKRADILTRAEYMDSYAVGDFYAKSLELAVKHGRSLGAEEASKDAEKRITKATAQARQNGTVEAMAKAQQLVRAGVAASTATTPSKTSTGPLTLEEAQTLSIDELKQRTQAQ